jgi:uncharacterized membrane protein YuzA (DUF378 family)
MALPDYYEIELLLVIGWIAQNMVNTVFGQSVTCSVVFGSKTNLSQSWYILTHITHITLQGTTLNYPVQ